MMEKETESGFGRTMFRNLLDFYLNGRIRFTNLKNTVVSRYEITPDELFWVDPSSIQYTMDWNELEHRGRIERPAHFEKSKFKIAGTILSGDWDLVDKRFEENVVYRSFVAHFEEDVPWVETDLYLDVVERIESGERWWRCSSVECFEKRCRDLDRLYTEIKQNGYKPQHQLVCENSTPILQTRGAKNKNPNQVIRSEIAVNVGRDGKLIFFDGRNRLSIAKILELDRIPVVILVRHERWQRLREKVVRGEVMQSEVPERIRHHPDLPWA